LAAKTVPQLSAAFVILPKEELKDLSGTADLLPMSAAPHLEAHDPVAAARAKYRAELAEIVNELADELGYSNGTFVQAARKGAVAVTEETSELVVAARLAL
jgi:hypothetical protein